MSPDFEKLERIIDRYLADEARDDESAWLSARLGESPEEMDLMVDRVLLEAELIRLGSAGVLSAGEAGPRIAWWRRPGLQSLGVAAALLLLLAGLLSLIAAPDPPPFAEWQGSPGSVVSVSGGGGSGSELELGSTLRVSQGCAEVVLESGVRCVVQAPASLRLEQRGRAYLEGGAARFRVEPQAVGFEVRSKGLSIIDLGTEFGIEARGENHAEVHVFEGRVEVAATSGRKAVTRVDAGNAVALAAAGALEAVPLDEARFLEELPKGVPAVRFSFDRAGSEPLAGEGAIARRTGARLRMPETNAPVSAPGRFGDALVFNGGDSMVSNWRGVAGTQPRTVSFWVKFDPAERKWPYPLIGWGNFHDASKMSYFGLRLEERSGQLRIVSGRRWLEGESDLTDGAWHHVAVVLGSYQRGTWPETKLFIDGVEEQLVPGEPESGQVASLDTFWTDVDHVLSLPLVIGRFSEEGPSMLPGLRGALDEVILAEGVITREQVLALYEGRLEDSGLDLADE